MPIAKNSDFSQEISRRFVEKGVLIPDELAQALSELWLIQPGLALAIEGEIPSIILVGKADISRIANEHPSN